LSDDHDILRQIAEGDGHAFDLLYEKYSLYVYNLTLNYLQNSIWAEEATQETFIKVYRSAHNFKFQSSVKTWLYRITINNCINFQKKENKKRSLPLMDDSQEVKHFDHPGVILENKERTQLLFAAIEKLSSNQKASFILAYIDQMPQREIADVMELSVKAVESLLQRAKSNLRNILKEMYFERRK